VGDGIATTLVRGLNPAHTAGLRVIIALWSTRHPLPVMLALPEDGAGKSA
jgi:hypothetical protein